MARALNTGHSLYGNLKLLVAVDDDNTTAREFVTGEAVSLDASVTIASGAKGYGVQTYASGLYTTNSFQLVTPVPMVNTGTWFFAFNNITSAQKNFRMVDFSSSDDSHPMLHGDFTTDGWVKFYDGHFNPRGSSVQMPAGTGVPFTLTLGFTNNNATGGTLRYDDVSCESGVAVSDWSAYSHSVQRPFHSTQGATSANLFAWALFDKHLSGAESDELYNSLTGSGAFSLLSTPGGSGTKSRQILLGVG